MEMQNALDFEDRHYKRKMENYEEQINTLYDELERIESVIDELEIRKEGIKKQAITVDNIYKCLVEFNSMYINTLIIKILTIYFITILIFFSIYITIHTTSTNRTLNYTRQKMLSPKIIFLAWPTFSLFP